MARHRFLSLEGGEGVGKTTQMKLLKERLPELFPGHNFLFTREPGGTPMAEKIRDIILSPESADADGKTMFGLFAAARAAHLSRIIMPALAEGKVVVSDRFAAATYAYQVVAQENPILPGLFSEYYMQLEARPAMTIILDLDPRIAQERIRERAGLDKTHFDTRPIEFHEKLRKGYFGFATRFNNPNAHVAVISAEGSPDAVHEIIVQRIRDIFEVFF